MKIRRLNEQGEEEDDGDEMQSEELTRSFSELLFAYSLETEDCLTSKSDDEENSFAAYSIEQVEKVPNNAYSEDSEAKNTTLLFHCLPQGTLEKQWLLNRFNWPTRALQVSFSSGIRRRRKNKSFGRQQNLPRWLPLLRKLSVSEQDRDETREVVDKEERQVCELLSSVSLSHRRRKTIWTPHKTKKLGWVVTVSFP
ncbi:hypothetical protein Gasu2_14080 [Galdieria sulphuraria]|uniref:Uncharacterized protein n=1 Tax=Galdieria sulphuraria TaxID=130081 RepID=M2XA52_GALSU|nr:uncharacterized protein Gasu_56490 [Galdieria sulphuraria]EME26752.1 hypothetical protein Gasu_56490 [Galdieria sulphuraria]GJD07024.1 hypothetical protein Gasu2_14080 [Galdieria sulphuraria]|eukprot:XP_005703272.1 hypothetical protein Gasu_56490 [Galdieria sulphuraria]